MTQFPEQNITASDEFKKLEELGFVSDYIRMTGKGADRQMHPEVTAAEALALGFFPRGTKVRYLDRNGYDHQRQAARDALLNTEDIYVVQYCYIGRSSSTYSLKGIIGRWNSVMFEKVDG
jgi:hypothetical protein